jgi:hypothetical protein
MAYDLNQAYFFGDGASIGTYPLRQSINVNTLLVGGAESIIATTGATAPALQTFLTLTYRVLSFAIRQNQTGGVLRLETTLNSGVTWNAVHAFSFTGYNVVDSIVDFELSFPQMRFILVNNTGPDSTFIGWLSLRSF